MPQSNGKALFLTLIASVEDPSRDHFGTIEVYTLILRSLVTYANALLDGFNMANPSLHFYVNDEYQLPRYFEWMWTAGRGSRQWYLQTYKRGNTPVNDAEVLQLVAATDWSPIFAPQLIRFILVSNTSTLPVVGNCLLKITTFADPQERMSVAGCRPKFSELKQAMP